MKLKQNLLKNINSIAIGFGLIGFTALTDVAKAEAPPKCTAAIGAKVDGKYTKTATQIDNLGISFCTDTPDRFEITIYELGLCTAQPIKTGSPRTFSRDDCVVTMTSSGSTADLANSTVTLPSMNGRPASNTYTHAYIILTNTFGLKGSVTIKNGSGDDLKYCPDTNGDSSGGTTAASGFCTPQPHTEILNDFGDGSFSAYFPLDAEDGEMDGGGKVSALLTGDDVNLTTATQASEAKRLIGVFETNSGNPVVINDQTNGLEMQLTVTDIGYGIGFSGGEPVDFGSQPFKPVFKTF